MRRREFITLFGSAAAWPLTAHAQQRMKRIGVLMADDPETQARLAAFAQGLQQLGWTVGQNVLVDYRFGNGNADAVRNASELVALGPDVILAHSSGAVTAVLQTTRTVPIVFTVVADPVGAGFVESLAHRGGNVTGFTNFECAISGKWLELLKEIAAAVRRVAVLRESAISAGPAQFSAIQIIAFSHGLDPELTQLRVPRCRRWCIIGS
jgi:putative ABC transport system substrate-binding protein